MAFDPTKSRWSKRLVHYGDTPLDTGRRVLVYGYMGTGKSSLIATFPAPMMFDSSRMVTNAAITKSK